MLKKSLIVLTTLALCVSCFPPWRNTERRLSIAGMVQEQGTHRPVAGASVHVTGTTRGAMTDGSGHFQIWNIAPGDYVLRCSSIEFLTVESDTIHVSDTAWVIVNFAVEPNPDAGKGLIAL